MWDGKSKQEYAQTYADGTYPNGAPRIRSDAWPDDQLHLKGSSRRNPEYLSSFSRGISSTAMGGRGETSPHPSVRTSPTVPCRTSVWKNSHGGMDTINTKSSMRFPPGLVLPHQP